MSRRTFSDFNKEHSKVHERSLKHQATMYKQRADRDRKEGHIASDLEIAGRNRDLFELSQSAAELRQNSNKKSQAYKQAASLLKSAVNSENRYRTDMSRNIQRRQQQEAPRDITGQNSYYNRMQNMANQRAVTQNQTALEQQRRQQAEQDAFIRKYGDLNTMSADELRNRIKNLEQRKLDNQARRATDGVSAQSTNLGNSPSLPSGLINEQKRAEQQVQRLTPAQREHLDRDDAFADDFLKVYKKALPDAIRRDEEKKLTLADKKKLWSAADVLRKDVQTEGGQILGAEGKIEANKQARDSVEYLKKRGVDVDYLLESYSTQLDNEEAEKNAAAMKEWASESWINGAIASVGTALASPFTGLTSAAEDIRHAIRNTGSDKPVAINQKNRGLSNYTQAIREGVSENIKNPVWNFIYNAGMSAADSAAALAAGGLVGAGGIGSKLATRITQSAMSVGAADQTYNEAIERGIDPMNAMATAITAGVTEWVTEKYSIDGLKSMALKRPDSLRNLVMNIGRQMVTEGSEEAASDVLNTIADNIINGKKSQFEQNVKEYKNQGLTSEQARKAAMMDWLGNTAYDAAAGAFSGALMGVGAQGASFKQTRSNISDYGVSIAKAGEISSVIDYAKKFSGLEKQAGKADTDLKVGQLAEAVEKKVNDRISKAETVEELEEAYEDLKKDAPDTVGIQIDTAVRNKAIELSDTAEEEKRDAAERLVETSTDSLIERSNRMDEKITEENDEANNEQNRRETVFSEASQKEQTDNAPVREVETERIDGQEVEKVEPKITGNQQATLIHSNEPVHIEGFVQTGVDDVKVKIDGETDAVSLSELKFDSPFVEKMYKSAATLDDAAAASAMISNFDGKQNISVYFENFEKAYNFGTVGLDLDTVMKKTPFAIPKNLVELAYDLGYNHQQETHEEPLRVNRMGEGTAADIRDEIVKGDGYGDIDKALAKKLGVDIKLVDIAEDTNGEKNDKINGYLDIKNGQMVFSDAAESKLGVRVHESMEFVEAVTPKAYKQMMTTLLDYMAEESNLNTVYGMVMNYRDKYREAEGSKTFEEALGEFMNDAISGVFMNEQGAEDFIAWLHAKDLTETEEMSILQTIVKMIKSLVEKLKASLDYLTPAQKTTAKMQIKTQEKIEKMFMDAVDDASKVYRGEALEADQTEGQMAASRAHALKVGTDTSEKALEENKNKVSKMDPVVSIDGMRIREYGEKKRDQIINYFDSIGNEAKSRYGDVSLGRNSAKSIVGHNPNFVKMAAIPAIKEALENGYLCQYLENYDAEGVDRGLIVAPVTINNIEKSGEYLIGVSVKFTPSNNKMYIHELILIDKNGESVGAVANAAPKASRTTDSPSIISVLLDIYNVKKKNAGVSRKNSIKIDSEGHELTDEQQAFFADSKIRDGEGRLRVVYHGTNNTEFNIFDADRIGSASGDDGFFGKGFYFAYSRGEASYYGSKRIISAYINVKNPFNFETELGEYNGESSKYGGHASDAVRLMNLAEKFPDLAKGVTVSVAKQGSNDIVEISTDDFAKEFKKAIENKEFTFRTEKNQRGDEITIAEADPKEIEYEYDGKKQTEKYYEFEESFSGKPSPIDVAYAYLRKSVYSFINMQDFTKAVVLDNSEAFTNALKEKGYDGTIQSEDGDEVVAFYPEQIKSVENKTPTEDPDIRYSLADTKETADLIKENEHLKAAVENLEKEFELTGGTIPDAKKIQTAAGRILRKYNSKFDKQTLVENITNVYKYLREDGADFEEATKVMSEIAKGVLEKSENVDTTMADAYKELRDQIRNEGVTLSEKQKEEVAYTHGSYGQYRKNNFGRMKLRKSGTTLDQQWQEWSSQYPELFPADTNEADMPVVLEGILDALKPQVETLNGETIDQMAYGVAMEIYSELSKVPPKETFADQKEKEKHEAMMKVYETMEDLVEAYRKDNKATNDEEVAEALEEVKKEKAKRQARIFSEIQGLQEAKKTAKNPKTLAEYKKAIEKKENEIKRIRATNDKKIAEVRAKYQGQRLKQADQRRMTETKDKIRKLHQRFRQMIIKPSESMYVPQGLMNAAIECCELVNLGAKEGTQLFKALDDARREFARIKNDTENYGIDDFDPRIEGDLDHLSLLMREKGEDFSIYDLTAGELQEVYDCMSEIYESIRLSTKLIREEGEKDVRRAGRRVIEDLDAAKGVKNNFISKKLNSISTSFLNSFREFRRLGGYNDNSELMEMWNELNEGQRKMYDIQMEGEDLLGEVTARKDMEKLMNELDDKKGLVKVPLRFESGNAPVYVTKGMRLALILHGESYSNLRHMMKGGVMIPAEMEKYKKHKKEAYEKTRKVVGIDEATLAQMRAELSPEEKEILRVMRDFFHNWTGKHVNQTSLDLYGFKKARVENYYPISVDKDFVTTDISALKFDKTIEGAGFLKERVVSTKPIILESVIDTAQRSLNAVSMFSGLAVPIRNFNKIMNVTTYKPTESEGTLPGDETVWTVDTSVKKKMREVWGDRALKFIDDMIADLQQGRKGEPTLYDKLRGNYAGAVLTANASVIIKQTSAYPTCAAITGWSPTIKAMFRGGKNNWMLSRADQDLIAKYTPIYWVRNKGNSTRELAEIRETGAIINKIPPARFVKDAIQKVDMAMVGRFWYAAQYYVDKQRPDLKKNKENNPDAYYTEVAKVFDRTVGETQSTNMTLQNADIMRSQNAAAKMITMFMGQGLQNFGIVYDNFNNMLAKGKQVKEGRATKEDLKKARKDFANALSSQLVSAAVFAGLAIVARGLLHRMNPYRDDKEEITAEGIFWKWLDDMGDNIIGSVPLGSFVYEWSMALAAGERPYGQSDIVLQAISDLEKSTADLFKAIGKGKGIFDAVIEVGNDGSKLFGVPMENVVNLFNATVNHVKDITGGKGFLSYSSDQKNAPVNTLGKYLVESIEAGDKAAAEKYTEAIIDLGKNEDDVNTVIAKQLKEREDVIEAAKIKTTDTERYAKIKMDLIAKGYPEAAFEKAVKSLITAGNKKPKEKQDPEEIKERLSESGSLYEAVQRVEPKQAEYSGNDLVESVAKGDQKNIDAIVKAIVDDKVKIYGKEEGPKKAGTSIKTALTKAFKYQYNEGNASEKQKVMKLLQKVKIDGAPLYDQETFQKWYKESQK